MKLYLTYAKHATGCNIIETLYHAIQYRGKPTVKFKFDSSLPSGFIICGPKTITG